MRDITLLIFSLSSSFRLLSSKFRVNNEEMFVLLRFYWMLGRDITAMILKSKYGTGFYHSVSEDLQEIFPDVHSFSVTNLKYMRYFYEMYPNIKNRPQAGDDSVKEQNCPQAGDDLLAVKNHQQIVDEYNKQVVFCIPWGHQKLIIDKCKNNPEKALFYVRKTIENNWSRAMLLNFLDTDLYERQGKAVTNFAATLPAPQSDLAQAITRDPYNFDFITIRERYDEKELKDALMDNITKFLLELGNGFAFVGREVRLEIGATRKFRNGFLLENRIILTRNSEIPTRI